MQRFVPVFDAFTSGGGHAARAEFDVAGVHADSLQLGQS
jgi:hypothetical protein